MRPDFNYFIMIPPTNMEFHEDKIYERFDTHKYDGSPPQTSWNLPSLECKDDGQDKRNLLLDRGVGIAYDNGSWLPTRDGQQAPLTVLCIAKVMVFPKYPKQVSRMSLMCFTSISAFLVASNNAS